MIVSLVVDSDSFDFPDLLRFLQRSVRNRLVIPDAVMMEAFRGDPLQDLRHKFLPLEEHSHQVVLLKPGYQLIRLHGKPKGRQKRMIDSKMTDLFPTLCQRIRQALAGDKTALRFMDDFGRRANDSTNDLTLADSIRKSMEAVADSFRPSDIKRFRSGDDPGERLSARYFQILAALVVDTSEKYSIPIPSGKAILETYSFRFSLFYLILVMDRIWHGSHDALGTKKLSHDMSDTAVLAAATFFDGLSTKDGPLIARLKTGFAILNHLKSLKE